MNENTARPQGRVIVVHADGACIPNPGRGAWAATSKIVEDGLEVGRSVVVGRNPDTTNVRMEMRAATEGLRAGLLVADGAPVEVHSDNDVVVQGMSIWLSGWKARGWRTPKKKPVKNVDLWQELSTLAEGKPVTFHWVRGHAGDPHNEEVDALANAAALGAPLPETQNMENQ